MNLTKTIPSLVRACLVFAGVVLAASSAYAQGAGSVQGRVLNASNGSYLNNALVTIEGTKLESLTNQFGDYRFDGVPAGQVKVKAFYTGLTEKTILVSVPAGGSVTQDFDLTGVGLAAAKEGDVLKLDAFVVASKKETDAAAIAINEQRFAANIKNVVSTDAFGDIAEGNVGDFVKFLPGVTIDYVSPDARTISVRGVSPNYTSITVDGNAIASASSSSASRTFELEQVSLNNASRVEVTKSRTPDVAASALGGSVNLVPRSAFERNKASLTYRTFISLNGDEKQFNKTRGPTNEGSRKIKPGFDMVYVNPLSKNLGFTLSLLESNIYYPQHRSAPGWAPGQGAQVGATTEINVMRNYQVQDGPKNNQRESVAGTIDWRFTPRDVLSSSIQWSYYNASFSNRPITYTIGNSLPRDYDSTNGTYVRGALGAGSVALGGTSFRHKYGYTIQPDVKWRHTGPIWKLDAGASYSHGTNHYHDFEDSHFNGATFTLRGNPTGTAVNAATVDFTNINGGSYLYPTISVLNNTGTAPINLADPANYNITNVSVNPQNSVDLFKTIRFNAKRELNFSFPFSVKSGVQIQQQTRDIQGTNPGTINFVGPDKVANTADDKVSLYSVIDPQYSSGPFLFNTPQVPYPDPYQLFTLFKQHPEYFAQPTEATLIQNVAAASRYFRETILAAYLMGDARLVDGRLRAVGGVRFERTEDDAAGSLQDPVAAKAITDPIAAARARYGIRNLKNKENYAAGYPSLDVSFNATPSLIARAAYSRSIGRQDLGNIIPGVTLPDITTGVGNISVVNPGLQPTQTNAFDASFEYYFSKTGSISVGVFRKDFANFSGAQPAKVATVADLVELGVPDPQTYANGVVTFSTRVNVGDAKLTGVEFDYKQVLDFAFFPEWARKFNVFANYQQMHLEGNTLADFSNFIPTSGSWGIKYGARTFNAQLNWNYRGRQRLGAQSFAPGAYDYFKPRVYMDANFEYRFSGKVRLFVNARNLTNVAQDIQRYGPTTPSFARTYRREEFGVQYTVGIKGEL